MSKGTKFSQQLRRESANARAVQTSGGGDLGDFDSVQNLEVVCFVWMIPLGINLQQQLKQQK